MFVKVKRQAEFPPGCVSMFAGMRGIVAQGAPSTGFDTPVLVGGVRVSFRDSELFLIGWE